MDYWPIYIVCCQFIFLMMYELLLKNETFFNWNRAYLLVTSALSLVLPFIKIPILSQAIPESYAIRLPEVLIGGQVEEQTQLAEQLTPVLLSGTSVNYLAWLWGFGAVLYIAVLIYKFYRIGMFRYHNISKNENGYTIITLKQSEEAFSFLNAIYLGDQLNADQKDSILKHEKAHVKGKHTLDLLWFELLRIIFWFNPLIYMYQKRITEIHEFIADKSAAKHQKNYYENLLSKTFNIAQFSIVNQFYSSSLIKKRIIMLTKKQSNRILKLKYVLIMPIVAIILLVTSCETNSKPDTNQKTTVLEKIEALKVSIAENGEMTKEEQKALQALYLLSSNKSAIKETMTSEISFKMLDQAPIFPGCEDYDNLEELKQCFSKSISQHVANNFNTKLAKDMNLTGKQKISVAFEVSTSGEINNIKVRAVNEALSNEAKRVINALPKLQPGMHNGKAVTVPYVLPIIFEVQ
ncbi:MAG: M56 family metallopeptidase [Flavobacteriaceae bacterium]